MTKSLTVVFQGESINLTLEKVERSKLYGYIAAEVVDAMGQRCELATLSGDGHSIVGKGGTAIAYLSPGGLWRTKAELKPVDIHGKVTTPVPSSFAAPLKLDRKATVDGYLSHNIHLIYHLTPDKEHASLKKELRGGAIFQFPFSYRGGLEASVGFLLLGADGNLFLCVGAPTSLAFVGWNASARVQAETETALADEEDMLDFDLV
jgi:hypothetical protein